jgi:hypothetical protein
MGSVQIMATSPSSVEQYLRRRHELLEYDERSGNRAPVTRWRLLALTLAYSPMLALGALPVTAIVGLGAQAVSHFTSIGIGEVFFVVMVVVAGASLARAAVAWPRLVKQTALNRMLPTIVTILLVVAGLTEIISGSKAPDAVLAMWFLSFGWLFVFYPRSRQAWTAGSRVLWTIGPLVTTAVIIVVWTSGFFAYRFDRSLDELDRYVAQLDAGVRYHAGAQVGDFTILGRGFLRGCDHAFHIDGWHESDDRWIAHCPTATPSGDGIDHLQGDWYQYPRR